MTPYPRAVLAIALLLATACGSSDTPPRSTPSPSPTLPPVATDEANAQAALLTAADLGAPWRQPKDSPSQGKIGELCPGVPSDYVVVKPRATRNTTLINGPAFGFFRIVAYAPDQTDDWHAAWLAANAKCAASKFPDGKYVTLEPLTSLPPVAGSDEVVGRLERVYTDAAHTKLLYVRPTLYARVGRVVVAAQYAHVQPASDPTGKDLTTVTELLTKQVAKTRTAFGM